MAPHRIPFNKPATTPEQLLQKLEGQGLWVDAAGRKAALNYLRYVGGYRLKGYWHHLVAPQTKAFPHGFTFQQLVDHCEFDHELRTITMAAIARLEVAVRIVMVNYLSLKHSPHWFLDNAVFKAGKQQAVVEMRQKIDEEVNRSRDKTFVKHYFSTYSAPRLPPSWSVCECVTFGLRSRTYKILQDPVDRRAISMRFGIDTPDVFESWIHSLSV